MATKIRLTRMGDKKTPFYRIVVTDSRNSRDAEYIDQIGYINPLTNPETVKIDVEKAQKWIKTGAQPTDTAKAILKKNGVEFAATKKNDKKPAKKVATKKATDKKPAKKTATK